MITLTVEGVEYENFNSASVSTSMETLSGSFSFTAVTRNGEVPSFKGGESCTVLVDGEIVLTGYIEQVSINYNATSHEITYRGRDVTSDFGDSDLYAFDKLKVPITLENVLKKVIKAIAGSSIRVINEAGNLLFEEKRDLLKVENGQNAYEYVEKLARQKSVLITTDGFGNLIIKRPSNDIFKGRLLNLINDTEKQNNILENEVNINLINLYNRYIVFSQGNTVSVNQDKLEQASATGDFSGILSFVNQSAEVKDDDIREGRQIVIVAENPLSSTQSRERAKWESDIRNSRSREYSVKVQGFRNGDELWKADKFVFIKDEFTGIDSKMLIRDVEYSFDMSGKITMLTLIPPESYVLALQEPVKKQSGFIGNEFV